MKKIVVLVMIAIFMVVVGNLFGDIVINSNVENVTGEIYETVEVLDFDIVSDSSNEPAESMKIILSNDYGVATLDFLTVYIDSVEIYTSTYYNALDQTIIVSFYDFTIGIQSQNVKITVIPYEAGNFQAFISEIETDQNNYIFDPMIPGNILTIEDNTPPEIYFFDPIIASRGVIIRFQTGQCQKTTARLYIDNNIIVHEGWGSHQIDSYRDGNILLMPSNSYNYYVEVEDSFGNVTISDLQNFTTLDENVININYPMFESQIITYGTNRDTMYALLGQRVNFQVGLNRIYWNSYENSLVAIQSWSIINPVPDNLQYQDNGYIHQYGNLISNLWYMGQLNHVWTVINNQPGINGTNLVCFYFENEIPLGNSIQVENHCEIGVDVQNILPILQNTHDEKMLISNNGIRGDINGSGEYDSEDIQIMGEYLAGDYSYYNTRFNPEGEVNLQRGILVFSSPTILDFWALNGNGNFDLGQPFSLDDPDFIVDIEDIVVVGSTVTITTTEEANVASIFGFLNGNPWSQTLVQNPIRSGIEVYEYGSLEPVRIISSRSYFEFQIPDGLEDWKVEAAFVEMITTSADPQISEPKIQLLNNFPNPFNPSTTVSFSLAKLGKVEIEIYNIKGQKITMLVNENFKAGSHSVVWNAEGIPSSVYFCRLTIAGKTTTRKMILLR